MKIKHFKHEATAFLTIGALLGAALAGTWQWQISQNELDTQADQIASLQGELNRVIASTQATAPNELPGSEPTTDATNTSATDSGRVEPIIVFEPGGLFSEDARSELDRSLIRPLLAYNNESTDYIRTVHVSQDSSTSDFSVFVINSDESYSSFSYGDTTSDSQDWWIPNCFEACNFSASFAAEYPEIVQAANAQ